MKYLINIVFLLTALTAFGQNPNIELANEYFKNGEYEKAKEMFGSIAKDRKESRLIHGNYLNTLIKLKDFDTAEKFLKRQIKTYSNLITYQADLAYLLELSGQESAAKDAFENLIEKASEKDTYVYQLQNFFYQTNKMDLLIDLFLRSRKRSDIPDKHNVHLARAYLYAGKKDLMIEELLDYGVKNQKGNYVQRTIQDNFKEEDELVLLQRTLLKRIQANPNVPYYNELLIWHYIQQKEFMRAFSQAKALDRRFRMEGNKVFELASITYQNQDYRAAARMYQYIIDTHPQSVFYESSRRYLIQCKEEVVKTTYPINEADIVDLIEQYNSLLNELGRTPKTMDALRNMALLHGFYLGNHQKAIEILQEAVTSAGGNTKFKDQCKIDMGDIYVLKDEPWESTLIYMQVEKSQNEDRLGEIAKLKNARLHYFTGQFELSKEILDILKKATTREIANDAMQLSIHIQDNLGLDTTDAALKAYAAVELLLYQNKNSDALEQINMVFDAYKSHSLADELLWLKANTLLKLNRTEEAIATINVLLENYKYDILADDALFALAKITDQKLQNSTEAMNLYRRFLATFPGSIYAADARKRFRDLRGDFVY